MFYKALIISIFIHLLILSWDGRGFSFFSSRPREFSPRDRQLDYRIITLVELPPSAAVAGKTPGAQPQDEAPPKSPQQRRFSGISAAGKEKTLPASPPQAPAEIPPLSARNGPEPAGKSALPAQELQPGGTGQGFAPAGQEQSPDPPLPLTAGAEGGGEEGQAVKMNAGYASATNGADVTAGKAEADLADGRPEVWGDEAKPEPASTLANQADGISKAGEKGGLSAGGPDGAGPAGPVKVYHTDPVYPLAARRRGWEGTVYLTLLLAPEGTVFTVELTKSSGYAVLDGAAIEAVKQWRYTWPDGQTAGDKERTVTVKISFRLTEQ